MNSDREGDLRTNARRTTPFFEQEPLATILITGRSLFAGDLRRQHDDVDEEEQTLL